MIIQCEQCRTKFKLDDEKVTERGVKVRCAKCRHIFVVRRPEAAEETPASAPETGAMPAISAAMPAPPTLSAPADFEGIQTEPAETALPPEQAMVMPPPEPADAAAGTGIDFGAVLPQSHDAPPASEISFDFGEVQPPTDTPQGIAFDFTTKPTDVAAATTDGIDFSGFDFGDVSVARPEDSFSLGGFDLDDQAAVPPTAADSAAELDFSFGDAAPQTVAVPSDGLDFSNLDFGSPQPASAPAADNFNLGDFEFGTEAAAVTIPSDTQDSTLFNFGQPQPAAVPEETPATGQPAAEVAAADHAVEEAPPLSIASRRRQNPLVSALIIVACLLLVGALGFMSYLFLGNSDKAAKLFNKTAPVDDGRITVQKVQASFLTKGTAGDLLIITGEAVNNFSKPRAALQVKGTLFGPNNEMLSSQTAYAGNLLTREQLTTMPREKIETTMNNQFGDSLVNLEVAPGKAIPFTLVIINPPATAKNFGVEAVGSTVAASKQ